MKKNLKVLGLMSGTSADGLSLACCEVNFEFRKIKLLAFKNYPYEKKLQKRIIEARKLNAEGLSLLSYDLGRLWAELSLRFLRENAIKSSEIYAAGSHGQTVYHSSSLKNTFQIGEAAFLSEALKRPVVADFRPQDLAAGGEGAPLVPFFDEFVFGRGAAVALQNIGGVGNISVVGKKVRTYGFDTGPGNSLMDWAVGSLTGGAETFDRNGAWASAGVADMKKVSELLKKGFFLKKPPKSLDREEFGKIFLKKNFSLSYEKRFNLLATLNYFTAASIALAVKKNVREKLSGLIVSGGGALNHQLMKNLSILLPGLKVSSLEEHGFHPLAKEAMAFSLLAAAALNGLPANCPAVTGASGPRVLGKMMYSFGKINYKI